MQMKCQQCSKNYQLLNKMQKIVNSCQHTFCQPCIRKNIYQNHGYFICPKDQKIVQNKIKEFTPSQSIIGQLRGNNFNIQQQQNLMCKIHSKNIEYYCLNDQQEICSHCAIFGQHKNHTIQKFQSQFEKKQSLKIEEEYQKIEKQINKWNKQQEYAKQFLKQPLDKITQKINQKYDYYKSIIKQAQEKTIQNIYSLYGQTISKSFDKMKEERNKTMKMFEIIKTHYKYNKQNNNKQHNKLINQFQSIKDEIRSIKNFINKELQKLINKIQMFIKNQEFIMIKQFNFRTYDKENCKIEVLPIQVTRTIKFTQLNQQKIKDKTYNSFECDSKQKKLKKQQKSQKSKIINCEKKINTFQGKIKMQKIFQQINNPKNGILELIGLGIKDEHLNQIFDHWEQTGKKSSTLKIVKNEITDIGFKIIIKRMMYDKVVHTLNLTSNYLTEQSLDQVRSLIEKNCYLKNIYLTHNQIKPRKQTMKEFQKLGINLFI